MTPPARSRRARRPSGDDRERAILETAERLLAERPLSELSVDDLARGAGISRPTFYFYFPSKDAVVLTLIDRMIAEAESRKGDPLGALDRDAREVCRESLSVFFEGLSAHRSVILAGAELRASNPEARELWAQVMDGWVADTAAIIEFERARGKAPPGAPARDVAVALVQMNERALHAIFAGERPALAEEHALDVLTDVWLSAIYGTTQPG